MSFSSSPCKTTPIAAVSDTVSPTVPHNSHHPSPGPSLFQLRFQNKASLVGRDGSNVSLLCSSSSPSVLRGSPPVRHTMTHALGRSKGDPSRHTSFPQATRGPPSWPLGTPRSRGASAGLVSVSASSTVRAVHGNGLASSVTDSYPLTPLAHRMEDGGEEERRFGPATTRPLSLPPLSKGPPLPSPLRAAPCSMQKAIHTFGFLTPQQEKRLRQRATHDGPMAYPIALDGFENNERRCGSGMPVLLSCSSSSPSFSLHPHSHHSHSIASASPFPSGHPRGEAPLPRGGEGAAHARDDRHRGGHKGNAASGGISFSHSPSPAYPSSLSSSSSSSLASQDTLVPFRAGIPPPDPHHKEKRKDPQKGRVPLPLPRGEAREEGTPTPSKKKNNTNTTPTMGFTKRSCGTSLSPPPPAPLVRHPKGKDGWGHASGEEKMAARQSDRLRRRRTSSSWSSSSASTHRSGVCRGGEDLLSLASREEEGPRGGPTPTGRRRTPPPPLRVTPKTVTIPIQPARPLGQTVPYTPYTVAQFREMMQHTSKSVLLAGGGGGGEHSGVARDPRLVSASLGWEETEAQKHLKSRIQRARAYGVKMEMACRSGLWKAPPPPPLGEETASNDEGARGEEEEEEVRRRKTPPSSAPPSTSLSATVAPPPPVEGEEEVPASAGMAPTSHARPQAHFHPLAPAPAHVLHAQRQRRDKALQYGKNALRMAKTTDGKKSNPKQKKKRSGCAVREAGDEDGVQDEEEEDEEEDFFFCEAGEMGDGGELDERMQRVKALEAVRRACQESLQRFAKGGRGEGSGMERKEKKK